MAFYWCVPPPLGFDVLLIIHALPLNSFFDRYVFAMTMRIFRIRPPIECGSNEYTRGLKITYVLLYIKVSHFTLHL